MKAIRIIDIVKAVKAIDYTSADRFAEIDNVQFDSRLCNETSLFIPLVGGQTDGHDYVTKALALGAKATLWSKSQEEAPEGLAVIYVDDTLQAFQDLAAYYLDLLQVRVVGVTGSNGKTTTKDMTAAVLSSQFQVYKTQGNYNNEIGVPKTILDMPADTQVLVLEMGMDGFHQIDKLSSLSHPEIAIITLIGDSHLEFLKTRAGIAQAKLEITAGMQPGAPLIVPFDEPLLNKDLPNVTLETFGASPEASVWSSHIQVSADNTQFQVTFADGQTGRVELPVIGAYNANNAMAALLVGRYFGLSLDTMLAALADFQLTKNRTQWESGMAGSKLLNDAYNASPTSMKAILKDFQALPLSQGKRYAVLGDMRELGDNSDALHASVAQVLDLDKFAGVFLYGQHMKALAQALSSDKVHYFDLDHKEALVAAVKAILGPNDLVLIKSSFGTNLLEVVTALKA